MSGLRIILVDDELPARQRLEDLLSREHGIQQVSSFGDPHEAARALREGGADVAFIDVQMPELSGIDLVRSVGPAQMPVTIFVTAYDSYALQAFDVEAVDYLLKPYDDERFEQALARARERVEQLRARHLAEQLRAMLNGSGAAAGALESSPPPGAYRERVAVDVPGQRLLIPVGEIDYISAEGVYAELHAGGKTYLIRERMHLLERQLDPRHFCRIHRSTIINLARVAALEPYFHGDHFVRLRGGERLRLSRSRRDALAGRLGVSI